MTVLRVTAYVTTTLASLVFLALVIYGTVQLNRFQSALGGVFSRSPVSSSQPSYQQPTPQELDQQDPTGHTSFCFAHPTDPSCAGAN